MSAEEQRSPIPSSSPERGSNYDSFGFSLAKAAPLLRPLAWLHRHYFRVRSYGAERVPRRGAAIIAANHSGALPMDGVMLGVDLWQESGHRRIPRVIADHFVSQLPYVGVYFARLGAIGGSRRNLENLLRAGELVVVFPEGTAGVGKPFSQRYKLQRWQVGHAELAIRHRVPVIPVGIIGAEEQWPLLGRISGIKAFGAPYLPIPASPIPLPVRYHIYYGEPLYLHEEFGADASEDPAQTEQAALRVKGAVQALIDDGLERREGLFR